MSDLREKLLTVFGLLTVLYWLSRCVFPMVLPPLGPMPEVIGFTTGPQQAVVRNEVIRHVLAAWALIIAGVGAGLLLLIRRAAGRWLALALCAFLLLWVLGTRVQVVASYGWTKSIKVWTLLARTHPRVVVAWALDVAFSILTLAYLGRPGSLQQSGPATPTTID